MGVILHQGAWESHVQGEAVQVDNLAGGSARDVHWLNWRKAATGEPCDAETVTHGSERDGGKRASNGTSPAVYSTLWGRTPGSSLSTEQAVYMAKRQPEKSGQSTPFDKGVQGRYREVHTG